MKEVLPQWRPVGFFGDPNHAIRPWSARTPKPVQARVVHVRAGLREGLEAVGR